MTTLIQRDELPAELLPAELLPAELLPAQLLPTQFLSALVEVAREGDSDNVRAARRPTAVPAVSYAPAQPWARSERSTNCMIPPCR